MIYHKGRWLIEPEIKALLTKLEDLNKELRSDADKVLRENAELRAKVESANRQIAEYDDELRKTTNLLKAAVEDFRILGTMLEDGYGHCTAEIGCDECVLGGGNLADVCQWRHEAEALALIGEDGDTNG